MTKELRAPAPICDEELVLHAELTIQNVLVTMQERVCWTTLRALVGGHVFVTSSRVFVDIIVQSFRNMLWVRDSEKRGAHSTDNGGNVQVFDKVFQE